MTMEGVTNSNGNSYSDDTNGSISSRQLEIGRDKEQSSNNNHNMNGNRRESTTCRSIKEHSPLRMQQSRICLQLSKWSIFSLILLLLATIWIYSWIVLSKTDRNKDYYNDKFFRLEFEMNANELITTSLDRTSRIIDGIYSFSLSLTALATTTNSTWPYVTQPDFDTIAEETRKQTGTLLLAYSPLVRGEDKPLWEKYSVANQGWLHKQNQVESETTPVSIPNEIYNDVGHSIVIDGTNDSTNFSPLWQMSPRPRSPFVINFNLLSRDKCMKLVEYTLETGKPTISEPFDSLEELFGMSVPYSTDHPQSILVQPIIDNNYNSSNNNNKHGIVGHLIAVIPWDIYFENIFEEHKERRRRQQQTTTTTEIATTYDEDHQNFVALHCVQNYSCSTSSVSSDGSFSGSSDRLFTYMINGPNAVFLGPGDFHNVNYDTIVATSAFLQVPNQTSDETKCAYTLYVYPADEMHNRYFSSYIDNYTFPKLYKDYIIAVLVLVAFVALFFLIYDYFGRRQNRYLQQQSIDTDLSNRCNNNRNAVLANTTLMHDSSLSMFFGDGVDNITPYDHINNNNSTFFEKVDDDLQYMFDSKPKADLFLNSSVLFADIAGFTAWSSVREPTQVFSLLETIYSAFDRIAISEGVLKVESIGDCYVAVVGLPKPRDDHAIVMARFAQKCKSKFNKLTHVLEVTLGPETGELAIKIGVHSGPVTAGVLRGPNRSRFQLFGDTVNTASRLENTGKRNRIHLSQQTAELLIASGNPQWVKARKEQITAKGKGKIATYWLVEGSIINDSDTSNNNSNTNISGLPPDNSGNGVANELAAGNGKTENKPNSPVQARRRNRRSSMFGNADGSDNGGITEEKLKLATEEPQQDFDLVSPENRGQSGTLQLPTENDNTIGVSDKMTRLVDWNSEVLLKLLKQIVARRNCMKRGSNSTPHRSLDAVMRAETKIAESGKFVRNEIVEVITLPSFDAKAAKKQMDPRTIDLGEEVESQLRDYVALIASMYRPNPFHNFEHASHVTMSTVKLLSRIVAPTVTSSTNTRLASIRRKSNERGVSANKLHDHTYGITSDPLTQFAVVFSALIHDADHRGVPNFLLVRDDEELASMYNNLSIAEQNSVDLAWDSLMDPKFEELRNCIYADEIELNRFRQLIVNSVMATDIFDKELSTLRKNRWDKAFHIHNENNSDESKTNSSDTGNDRGTDVNRKATIVIEHLIQASDVVHTMQHWQIYQKWNQRLFEEMMVAYHTGRSSNDPTTGWYKGELGFLDNYVIPLAKKLKECGVFGVSSDEYLNYATENRKEWESKGHDIVRQLAKKYQKQYGNRTQ